MHIRGPDFTHAKHVGSSDPSTKLILNGLSRFRVVACDGSWVVQAPLPLSPPPPLIGLTPKWDIVPAHLAEVNSLPNFSLMA